MTTQVACVMASFTFTLHVLKNLTILPKGQMDPEDQITLSRFLLVLLC